MRKVRIAVVSRIFDPEPSAASFRLKALATALSQAGYSVEVLTVVPPKPLRSEAQDTQYPFRVRRAPVVRDKFGYVRGYVPYMSFDIPVFFRILCGPRVEVIIVEPPPTTGLSVRLAAWLRRIPYVYYAPDLWADASVQTGAPRAVVRLVRAIELLALRGAKLVLSVSTGVTQRLAELGVSKNVVTVGNGIDVEAFGTPALPTSGGINNKVFIYAGTASEWHGAGIFLEAMPRVLAEHPDARLIYVGGGSEKEALEQRAITLNVGSAVRFEDTRQPEALGEDLRNCCAAVASVRPGAGYDFAFPTKLYSAAACGAPTIYAGIGPGVEFVRSQVAGSEIGKAAGSETESVAIAMIEAAAAPFDAERRRAIMDWASNEVSIRGVAAKAVTEIGSALGR